jgi:DNA-binding NtrC family response regulator
VQQQKLICSGQLPLAGKSLLIVEDEVANSIALAKSALEEGIQFDVAIVDLILEDGNATPLFQVLSEREIPVVITTGDQVD